jgi:hypothetical protein
LQEITSRHKPHNERPGESGQEGNAMSNDNEKVIRERTIARLDGEDPEVRQAKRHIELQELEAEERAERDLPLLEAEERAERPAAERREAWIEHNTAAREFELIADRMGAKVPERRKKIADTLKKYKPGKVPPGEFSEVREEAAKLLAENGAGRKAAKLVKREKRAAGRLYVKEPGPYDDKGSPHSWVWDTAAYRVREQARVLGVGAPEVKSTEGSLMTPASVLERLSHHGQDIRSAISKRSKYGQRAEAIMHENLRGEVTTRARCRRSRLRGPRIRPRSSTPAGSISGAASCGRSGPMEVSLPRRQAKPRALSRPTCSSRRGPASERLTHPSAASVGRKICPPMASTCMSHT